MNSKRNREDRHDAMTASVQVIVRNAKTVQDAKTERLRKLREARDAVPQTPVKPEAKPARKRKASRSIPVEKLNSQNDV